MSQNAGLILCGGRSSRMGRPKALLPWAGATMLEHVAATLRRVVDELVVVGAAELELPPLDATVVVDEEPFLGPLAGLAAGLAVARAPSVFATATDTPWLRAEPTSRTITAPAKSVHGRTSREIAARTTVYARNSGSWR